MSKVSGYVRGLVLSLGMLAAAGVVFAPAAVAAGYGSGKATKDIVETAVAAGSFDTLVTAVQAAGLVETLKGKGPFTVFAPTDAAFAKIPKEKLDALLADKDALARVLTYHVVPGRVMAADAMRLTSAKTVEGGVIDIDTRYGVKVDGAKVVQTDIETSNGVIHVIDTVIMPKDMTSAIGAKTDRNHAVWQRQEEMASYGR